MKNPLYMPPINLLDGSILKPFISGTKKRPSKGAFFLFRTIRAFLRVIFLNRAYIPVMGADVANGLDGSTGAGLRGHDRQSA